MSDQFLGEIRIVGFNFAPTGWAQCNGQLLPISQNTALFSLLGTFYGGDGKSTFALPDMQGRAPVQPGQGQGLTERFVGEQGGQETVTLIESEMPAHSHTLRATGSDANSRDATNRLFARAQGDFSYRADGLSNPVPMALNSLTTAGGSLPHNNMQPYLALNFVIALQGIYPQRS